MKMLQICPKLWLPYFPFELWLAGIYEIYNWRGLSRYELSIKYAQYRIDMISIGFEYERRENFGLDFV